MRAAWRSWRRREASRLPVFPASGAPFPSSPTASRSTGSSGRCGVTGRISCTRTWQRRAPWAGWRRGWPAFPPSCTPTTATCFTATSRSARRICSSASNGRWRAARIALWFSARGRSGRSWVLASGARSRWSASRWGWSWSRFSPPSGAGASCGPNWGCRTKHPWSASWPGWCRSRPTACSWKPPAAWRTAGPIPAS